MLKKKWAWVTFVFFGLPLFAFLFQNCSPANFEIVPETSVSSQSLSSQLIDHCQNNPSAPNCHPANGSLPSCSFNGQTIPSGGTVTAFLSSTATTCQSQIRACEAGVLSGTFAFFECTEQPGAPSACLFDGRTIAHGQTVAAYQNSNVGFGATCTSQSRTCNNGALSGSYNFASCSVGQPASCLFNNQSVAHGQAVAAYQQGAVPFGGTCVGEARVCNNGSLSGTYNFASCTVGQAAACLFNNQTIAHGQSVVAYQSSQVPAGSNCQSQNRTCSNGTLSGSFGFQSCTVLSLTYSWSVGSWGACQGQNTSCNGGGARLRQVQCVSDQTGQAVADSFCAGAKPLMQESCEVGQACRKVLSLITMNFSGKTCQPHGWYQHGAIYGRPCLIPGSVEYDLWAAGPIWTADNPGVCPQGQAHTVQNTYQCVFCPSGRWGPSSYSTSERYLNGTYENIQCLN